MDALIQCDSCSRILFFLPVPTATRPSSNRRASSSDSLVTATLKAPLPGTTGGQPALFGVT